MPTCLFRETAAAHRIDMAPRSLDVLQLNITRLCNQACMHCHVSASPARSEMMSGEVLHECVRVVAEHPAISTVDITGGAPELHPGFVRLLDLLRPLGRRMIVRHNLTVALDPHPLTGESLSFLPELFSAHGVEVIASLPCFTAESTDRQRGAGVFEKSIDGLRHLNAVGYGIPGSRLVLNLVYNPEGPALPARQADLERQYRVGLAAHGIAFTSLYALANMPAGRFGERLRASGMAEEYRAALELAYNPAAASNVMCRSTLSVAPDGTLHDCDFNQMLGLGLDEAAPSTIFDFDEGALLAREIRFADHCFTCTAGAGSSCGGATVRAD